MKPYFQQHGVTLHHGDCRKIAWQADVVVTDPVWDQAVGIPGAGLGRELIADMADSLCRCRMVVMQLGCYTDPGMVFPIGQRMPFFHVCWLRYVPSSYRGRVLVDADVAYCFGVPPKSRPGRMVISSSYTSTGRSKDEKFAIRGHGRNRSSSKFKERATEMAHPMPRHLSHVRWLINWHTEDSDTVFDPFAGSGTTAVAAIQAGRKFVGCEIKEEYCELAAGRIERALESGKSDLPFSGKKRSPDATMFSEAAT